MNKHHWQYKGLVQWILPMNGHPRIMETIHGDILDSIYHATTNKTVKISLPRNKSGYSHFNNGSYAGVYFYNDNIQHIAEGVTFSFWIKTSLIRDAVGIYANNASTGTDIRLTLNLAFNNVIRCEVGPFLMDFYSPVSLKDNSWHNIIVSISENNTSVYVDGNTTSSQGFPTTLTNWTNNFTRLCHGNNAEGGYPELGVYLSDFRVYNYPWCAGRAAKYNSTKDEILALYLPRRMLNDGSGGINSLTSSLTLHTLNIETLDNNLTLYSSGGVVPYSGDLTLYTYSATSIDNNIPLYSSGNLVFESGSLTLHTYSVDSTYNSTDLYTSGWWYPANNNTPLYIRVLETLNSGVDLYTFGSYLDSSGVDLSIWGYDVKSSGVNLFMRSALPVSGNVSLYTKGHIVDYQSCTLYTSGTSRQYSDNLDLFLYAGNSGVTELYGSTPLFLKNSQQFDPAYTITLYMPGPREVGIKSATLFVKNDENLLNNSVNLFINGPGGTPYSGITLYIGTPPGTTGSVPFSDSMTLFMNRYRDSYASSTPLYVKVAEGVVGGMNLYTSGTYHLTNSIPLYIEGSGVPVYTTNSTYLFNRGGV